MDKRQQNYYNKSVEFEQPPTHQKGALSVITSPVATNNKLPDLFGNEKPVYSIRKTGYHGVQDAFYSQNTLNLMRPKPELSYLDRQTVSPMNMEKLDVPMGYQYGKANPKNVDDTSNQRYLALQNKIGMGDGVINRLNPFAPTQALKRTIDVPLMKNSVDFKVPDYQKSKVYHF